MGPMAQIRRRRARSQSIAFVLLAALIPPSYAQISPTSSDRDATAGERVPGLVYGVDVGVGESDNVTLVPTDQVSQTMAIADLDFTAKEQSRLFTLNSTGKFSYLDYLQNAYGSQLLGRFDGEGTVAIIPERVTWTMQDNFGQATLDPYSAVTPTNLENVNYFSTGPEFITRWGGVNFIDLSARYSNVKYQTSPFTSNRGLGSVAVGRDISAGASVSFNANFERVMFVNTEANSDYDRTGVFGSYKLHGARTDFEGDLGASRVSQPGSSSDGLLSKVQLSRKVSPAAKLIFTAGRELTDAGSSFGTLQSGGAGPVGIIGSAPAAQTSGSYTSTYASAGWAFARNRTTIAVNARWEKDIYPGQASLDVNRPSADFSLSRQLTRAFSAEVFGRLYKMDFPNVAIASTTTSSNYEDWLLGGSLSWRYGRGLEIQLRYNHESRAVSAGGSGFGENRAFLTVGYRPRPMVE